MINYTLAPRVILDTNLLSDRDKIVYLKLLDYAFNKIYCFPKQTTVIKKLGISQATLKRAIKRLKELGLVKVYRPNLKVSNQYIILPIEWVDLESETIIPYEDRYIDSEEELDELVEKIRSFYREQSEEIKPKKKKRKKTTKTTADKLAEKLINNNYELTGAEYCQYFANQLMTIRGLKYSINWPKESAVMKKLFVENDKIEGKLAIKLIDKFIEMYDFHFKNADYPTPRISHLSVGFIFNKVATALYTELEESERENNTIERVDIEF